MCSGYLVAYILRCPKYRYRQMSLGYSTPEFCKHSSCPPRPATTRNALWSGSIMSASALPLHPSASGCALTASKQRAAGRDAHWLDYMQGFFVDLKH